MFNTRIFHQMIGKVMSSVTAHRGTQEQDVLHFVAETGEEFKFEHSQDCCESVSIEDINGDLQDLVGSPMTMAEEVEGSQEPRVQDYPDESFTWSYYKFATSKGYVTVRFYGSSNGYYSEGVSFWMKDSVAERFEMCWE
jgi:hypothetical protein